MRALSSGLIEAAVLLVAVAVPLFVNFYSFRVFEASKHALVVALAVVVALGALVALLEGGLGGLRAALRRPLVVAALLVLVTTGLATAASLDPALSVYGSHERAMGLIALIGGLALFAGIGWTARDPERRARLVAVLVAGSVPVAGFALAQALGLEVVPGEVESQARVFGTLSNPIFLGAYLMLTLPLTIARALAAVREARPMVFSGYVLVAAIGLIALFLSASRGPQLGLAAALFVMLVAGGAAARRRGLGWLAVGVAVLGLAFIGAFNLPDSPLAPLREAPVIGRFGQITATESGSEAVRLRVWRAVDALLAERATEDPVRLAIGSGPETLKYALIPHAEPNMAGRAQAERLVDRAHNVLLDALVMTGLLGALAWLLLYGAWLYAGTVAVGLAERTSDRRLLAALLGLGTVAGAASWFIASELAGALTLLGLAVGLVLYLVIVLARGRGPEDGPVDLLALALLAIGVAAVVEAAFGIQTVVTHAVLWLVAGLLVARRAGDVTPEETAQAARAALGRRRPATAEADTVELSWSPGGAALGLIVGSGMGLLLYDFLVLGAQRLPATLGVTLGLALLLWLAGLLAAADAGESVVATGVAALVAFGLYALLRAGVLSVTGNGPTLYALTVLWLVLAAAAAGVLLRGHAPRAPMLRGPVAIVYPLAAVLAVAVLFRVSVQPVQADMYFQSALATFDAALRITDPQRSADARTMLEQSNALFERAVALNPDEDTYQSQMAERYTVLGQAAVRLGGAEAAAPYFGQAQTYASEAERLDPLMPYHTFNRGHLQLVFAQGLPPDNPSRAQAARNAAVALDEAFAQLSHDPQVAVELGMAKLLSGDPDGAVAQLEYARKLDPDRAATYPVLAQAHLSAGDPAAAQATLEAGYEELGDALGAQGVGLLGDIARQQGDLSTARQWYETALQMPGADWRMAYNLGLLYGQLGETDAAVQILGQAQQAAPSQEVAQQIQGAIDSVLSGGSPGAGQPQPPPSIVPGTPSQELP